MPIAYLTTAGLKVSVTSERLEVSAPADADAVPPTEAVRRQIPFVDLEHVVVDAAVSLTTPALCALLEHGIPIIFLAHGHAPAGVALPLQRGTTILASQLDRARDRVFRLEQARLLVRAKILNQRRVLQRLAANRKQTLLAVPWLNAIASQAAAAASVDSLRGLEGAAAGRYFEELSQFFPAALPFERRTRRPPHNEANSLLSFLYTLLGTELALHLRACGLEPGWGVYHEAEDGRPALALDLLEPFRAPIADALALDLFNHKRLQEKDFYRVEQACLLKRTSRRTVFVALENRLEREFFHEQSGHRTTLRRLFKELCLGAKRAFSEGVPLEPFQMN